MADRIRVTSPIDGTQKSWHLSSGPQSSTCGHVHPVDAPASPRSRRQSMSIPADWLQVLDLIGTPRRGRAAPSQLASKEHRVPPRSLCLPDSCTRLSLEIAWLRLVAFQVLPVSQSLT